MVLWLIGQFIFKGQQMLPSMETFMPLQAVLADPNQSQQCTTFLVVFLPLTEI